MMNLKIIYINRKRNIYDTISDYLVSEKIICLQSQQSLQKSMNFFLLASLATNAQK